VTELRWLTDPAAVDPDLRAALLACWRDVTNTGGAVGFPAVPVDDATVAPVLDVLVGSLSADVQLLVATRADVLGGWLVLERNPQPIFAHWATLKRVQTSPAARGTGVGGRLLAEAAGRARALGLHALHLTVRAGTGADGFYARHGYREVGRWPGAIRLGDGELRDELLMHLALPGVDQLS
jgi:GNAT superfamily N-acetyltransferase